MGKTQISLILTLKMTHLHLLKLFKLIKKLLVSYLSKAKIKAFFYIPIPSFYPSATQNENSKTPPSFLRKNGKKFTNNSNFKF